MSALGRVLKNVSVEQILLSRKAMLKGMDCLVWDGWQDDLRRYQNALRTLPSTKHKESQVFTIFVPVL